MKRLLLFFALVTMLVSCTVDTTSVVNLTAQEQDWVINSDIPNFNPLYYSRTFSMPEITPNVYSQGSVQTYIVLDGAQETLPYVLHYKDGDALWTRTVDCQYSVGSITIFVTNSDFVVDPPKAMDFRVVVMR